MICTIHNVLGPLDNKVNEPTTFTSNMLKNARKIKMLNPYRTNVENRVSS
jgi:hypothetical protein